MRDCPHKGDLGCDNHIDSTSHLTQACNLTRAANRKPVHPYLKRNSHTRNRVNLEGLDSFEGHPDDSVTLFSEDDTRAKQVPKHIGCQVYVEPCTFSADKGDYTSGYDTEARPTKAKVLG